MNKAEKQRITSLEEHCVNQARPIHELIEALSNHRETDTNTFLEAGKRFKKLEERLENQNSLDAEYFLVIEKRLKALERKPPIESDNCPNRELCTLVSTYRDRAFEAEGSVGQIGKAVVEEMISVYKTKKAVRDILGL